MLVLDDAKQRAQDPCMLAIHKDRLDVVQLLEEYGSKSVQYFNAFRYAVMHGKITVVEYLHIKYRHPLNINYKVSVTNKHWNVLKESCYHKCLKAVEYLLENGVDPNKVNTDGCPSVLNVAMQSHYPDLIALLIRNGVDINFRSYDDTFGDVLPFKVAVMHGRDFYYYPSCALEMLLVSGSSSGRFILDGDKELQPQLNSDELENLMMWDSYMIMVKPLKMQCRRMILKHLSPRANKMIEKLPLPQCLIKYLSIPELDDIVDRYEKMPRRRQNAMDEVGL